MFSQSIKWMKESIAQHQQSMRRQHYIHSWAPTKHGIEEKERERESLNLNRCHFDYNRFSSFTFTGRASGIHKHASNHHIHSFWLKRFPCSLLMFCFFVLLLLVCIDPFSVLPSKATISTFFQTRSSTFFLNKHINSISYSGHVVIGPTDITLPSVLAIAHNNNQKTWYPQCVYL